jgi:hypothetical protein
MQSSYDEAHYKTNVGANFPDQPTIAASEQEKSASNG